MTNVIEQAFIPPAGIIHRSTVRVVLRDGRTGEIKAVRENVMNAKVAGTWNMLISGVTNSTGTQSCVFAGLGTGENWATADTTLTDEVLSRTIGNLSHDAASPTWSLSFSWTDSATSESIAQAGIFTSYTGGILYLKATLRYLVKRILGAIFARLTKNSQDVLNIAWTRGARVTPGFGL